MARILQGHLESLGALGEDTSLQCFVCEEMPGGTEWRSWIIDKTQQADCLIFLHTSTEHSWTWCATEIAQYDGYRRALKAKSRIGWFSLDSSPSFPMLSDYQFYRPDDEDIRKFLKDVFETTAYSAAALIPRLHIDHAADFNDAVKDIHDKFSEITRPEELFKRRLRIALSDEASFDKMIKQVAPLSCTDRADRLLQGATLEADPATVQFLMGPVNDAFTWPNLVSAQDSLNSRMWIDQLQAYLAGSFPDAAPDERRSREQVLTGMFREQGSHLPVIARLEYVDRQPFSIVLIFVPLPSFSEDPQLMMLHGMPREVVYLSLLHRLARRFRWTFLEPLYNLVEYDHGPIDDARWKTVVTQYQTSMRELNAIEQHARIKEFMSIAGLDDATGLKSPDLLRAMSNDYPKFKDELEGAMKAKLPEQVKQTLAPWMCRNKELLLAIVDESRSQVEKLRPKENLPP